MGKYFKKNRVPQTRRQLILKAIIIREKKLILSKYSFLDCAIIGNKLIIKGTYKPTEYSQIYSYRIEYDGFYSPSVYVEDPIIEYNDDIHMYPKDNSLCLFFPKEMEWDGRFHHLFNTIINWTNEWLVFYEKYLITGKWEHPYVQHLRVKEK